MSYPSLTGYGSYYDSNSNPNPQTAYGANRESAGSSYQQFQQDERQPQYGAAGYSWQGQNKPIYTNTQQPYSNDSFRDVSGQAGLSNHRRAASDLATQATAGNSKQNYYGSNTGQSMQELDNPGQNSSRPHHPDGSRSKDSANPNQVPNRVQSPVQILQPQQFPSAQPSNYGSHNWPAISKSSPQLAISAAQALAGATSRKYQQIWAPQKPTPQATSNGDPIQRTSSPYSASSKTQNHAQRSSGQALVDHLQLPDPRVACLDDMREQTPPTPQSRGFQHNRTPSQTKGSAASRSNSISNLVSTTQEPQTSTVVTDLMPTHIDPSQVFNPYHKEHERRRKEAVEAEIRRTEQELAAAKAQKELKRNEAEAAKAAKNAPNKKKVDIGAPKAIPKATSPVEDEMATEMKMMLEKMKEFRSKDPSLFQKLWEDLREGGSDGTALTITSSATPAPTDSATTAFKSATTSMNPAIPTHSAAAHLSQQSNSAHRSSATANPAPANANIRLHKSQQPKSAASELPGHPAANSYKVVVEDQKGLPDLGRFPAERRIRSSYQHRNGTQLTQMPGPSTESFPMPGFDNGHIPDQPLPGKSASGGVVWPKGKRAALAAAAVEALKANPDNEQTGISPADIHAMLEEEPSYIQLCALLEGKGLKFHRGQFARQLLSSVPDLTRNNCEDASNPPPTPTLEPPSQHQPSSMVQPPPHPPIDPRGHPRPPMPPNGFVPRPPGQFQAPHPTPFNHYPYIPPAIKPEHKSVPSQKPQKQKRSVIRTKPEPPPGSKEAIARKRDFSELIDLTHLSDNEDYVLSNKHPRLASSSPEPDPFAAYHLKQHLEANTLRPNPFSSNPTSLPKGSPLKFNPTQPAWTPAAIYAPPYLPQKPRMILARSLNKSEALRKSHYDPKTVARDILIAAGRHPSERPLNAHMAGLLGVHIDIDSDISTFDWDAIDPGGPPVPGVEYTDIPAGPPRFLPGARVNKSERLMPVEAEGEPRTDGSGKRGMQEPKAPASSRSGKVESLPSRGAKDINRIGLKRSKFRQSHAVDDTPSRSRAPTPQQRKLSVNLSPTPQRSSARQPRPSMEQGSGTSAPMGKRRGRPPGSKNKAPAPLAMKKAARAPQPLVEIPTRSSPQGNPVFKCRWRNCHAELHNLDTLRKHVARVHAPGKTEIEDHGFICWWKKCKHLVHEGYEILAEHSFERFEEWVDHIDEEHLHKVALKLGDGPNTAQIGKHAPASLDITRFRYDPTSTQASARTFSYTDPQSLAQDKARYLYDRDGKATTPSVSEKRNVDLPPDTLVLTKKTTGEDAAIDMAAQRSFLKVHHRDQRIGAKMNAEEVLRAMEKRKHDIGPGIDRGGCTLVNEHRRSTFVQSPGIRRVVDGDY